MTGTFLKMRKYEIKVLDLLSMEKSHCFNPFAYLQTDNDVQKLVTSLFKATTPKGSQSNDPFWDTAASMLLSAIIFYLLYEAPEEEQNFPMVMEMLRAGEVREDDDTYQSPLDELFERLEMRSPDHIAVKYYKDYHSGSAKTLKSIQITLAARMEKFNLASVAVLTATDELELASLGEKKVALFALIPDHDVSFNFLVSMVYSCTFEQLFRLADGKYHGALPVPVHFLMDEFANVSLPDDFDKLLATMRSRNVFVSIIIQNIAQLKNLFEKQWESILGNCDEFLYLGGNETGTHKMIAESYLGKQTIDLNTYGKSSGRSGNYSTNWQITGRELLDASEVRMLDNRYALLFIRGEMPVMDEKYDLLNHPNVKFTPEKGSAPYVHGGTELSVGSLSLTAVSGTETKLINLSEMEFELLSDEEIEAELLGGKTNEKHD
jgi:type IV secretion system protein VirD4